MGNSYYDKRIHIVIDRESYEELKKLAKLRKEKVSQIIRKLIYKELKEFRKQLKEG